MKPLRIKIMDSSQSERKFNHEGKKEKESHQEEAERAEARILPLLQTRN